MRNFRILLQPLFRSNDSICSKSISRNPNRIVYFNSLRGFTSSAQEQDRVQKPKIAPSEKVTEIVDELTGFSVLELAEVVHIVRKKVGIKEMPGIAIMMPGMTMGGKAGGAKGGAPAQEVKAEKSSFDLKLEGGYEASMKIKIIKEVRACTDLGLKEAKELVEKAPTLLKKGVPKEEAEKIIAKLKEVGAKVIME